MARPTAAPTGRERMFGEDEIIVSKTDLQGRITYANSVFLRVAGYAEEDVLGQPHSMIRHPGMPRAVFKLLWETIAGGREIFAYVKNMARDGDHYWVFAHVTPSFDSTAPSPAITRSGAGRGATPSRRRKAFTTAMIEIETNTADRREGMAASTALLLKVLEQKGCDYDTFVLSL